ncbi:MAG: hypothetical protein L0H22_12070, partial [Brevibacterium aurantiacum]|nr:hypothetical protein [Brevibacterium aurantiacum]
DIFGSRDAAGDWQFGRDGAGREQARRISHGAFDSRAVEPRYSTIAVPVGAGLPWERIIE